MKTSINNLSINLLKYLNYNTDFILLCLGSKNCVGDSLGCIVGSLLKYKYKLKNYCYGDFQNNITSKNLDEFLDLINRRHSGKKVLVVDSAIDSEVNIGSIRVHYGGIVPRSAVDNSFSVVGDVSITGVVSSKNFGVSSLFNVNPKQIFEMAEIIAQSIVKYKELVLCLKDSVNKKVNYSNKDMEK